MRFKYSHDVGSRNSTETFSVPDPNYCVDILKQLKVLNIFLLFDLREREQIELIRQY
jgi:hypothetical protein